MKIPTARYEVLYSARYSLSNRCAVRRVRLGSFFSLFLLCRSTWQNRTPIIIDACGGKIIYVSPYDSFANNKRKVRVRRSHSVARTFRCMYTHFARSSYITAEPR